MEPIKKDIYASSEVSIFEVKTESIIFVSGTRNGYGDAIEEEWDSVPKKVSE